jgi:Uma2 family endonuclease
LDGCAVLQLTNTNEWGRLGEVGVLVSGEPYELLEGLIVKKMNKSARHRMVVWNLDRTLLRMLPSDWISIAQDPIHLVNSEPEPDLVVVRGPMTRYRERHPRAKEVALVLEVAESSLSEDRGRKLAIYARARIPVYWIVNLVDDKVEVYTVPKAGKNPAYRSCVEYGPEDSIPVVVVGVEVGRIAAAEILV